MLISKEKRSKICSFRNNYLLLPTNLNHGNESKTKQGKGESGKPDDIRFLMRRDSGSTEECLNHRDVPTDEASRPD
jgi:hypothetical protein